MVCAVGEVRAFSNSLSVEENCRRFVLERINIYICVYSFSCHLHVKRFRSCDILCLILQHGKPQTRNLKLKINSLKSGHVQSDLAKAAYTLNTINA